MFQSIDERKNLLGQFSLWKSRKRRKFRIVVNEKGKREIVRQMRQKTRKEESEKVDFEGKVQCGNYF